jgi:hypothetical protein
MPIQETLTNRNMTEYKYDTTSSNVIKVGKRIKCAMSRLDLLAGALLLAFAVKEHQVSAIIQQYRNIPRLAGQQFWVDERDHSSL